MARNELRGRDNWQTASGPGGLAGTAEKNLYNAFRGAFRGTIYEFSDHPTDLKHLYEDVDLPEEVLAKIFCPDENTMKNAKKRGWGVSPDFSITNTETGKILFGEIKRQDGWVEGKDPSATRMNVCASCLLPDLLKHIDALAALQIPTFYLSGSF